MQKTISILILTHNRSQDLLALLESLSLQMGLPQVLEEILIINNASTESYDAVTQYILQHPEMPIKYRYSEVNTGVAAGRNILMKEAKGDLLLTLDDDMVFPQDDALLRMSSLFEKPEFVAANVAVITVDVIYYSTKEVQVTAFPHKKFHKFYGKNSFLTYYFAGGANLMKRNVALQSGGYPEDFFYGMEEYDLAYRILDLGYTFAYDNSITIEHKESPYGRQANYKKLQMQWVNKAKVAWRYLPVFYFFTTVLMWSFEYIRKAGGHWGAYFQSWWAVLQIPFQEKRKRISRKALHYLQQVQARLWY